MAASRILVVTGGEIDELSDDSINHMIASLRGSVGVAIPNDPNTDSQGLMNQANGLSMASDYMPKYLFRTVRIKGGAGGQSNVTIKVLYANGSVDTIPISSVPANDMIELPTDLYVGIYKTGTTAANLFPRF